MAVFRAMRSGGCSGHQPIRGLGSTVTIPDQGARHGVRTLSCALAWLATALTSGCYSSDVPATGVSVTAPGVRACDVVFHTTGRVRAVSSKVALARFHQTPRALAVSFASKSDEDLRQDVFQIGWESDDEAALELTRATCFDRLGRPLEGAQIRLP